MNIYPTLWRRQWHPTPVLLPGKSHGQRSLVDCSPWVRKESDMTERLPFHFSLLRIGEGNGNPLWHSCLENPGDGASWWAELDMTEVTQQQQQHHHRKPPNKVCYEREGEREREKGDHFKQFVDFFFPVLFLHVTSINILNITELN